MKKLSVDVKYAVIIFFDKSKLFIDMDQYNRLLIVMSDPAIKQVQIGYSVYYLGGISKVLTLQEFYDEYPSQRPDPRQGEDNKYANLPDNRSAATSRNGLASMIRGISKFIRQAKSSGQDPTGSINMREKWIQKFKMQYGELPEDLVRLIS